MSARRRAARLLTRASSRRTYATHSSMPSSSSSSSSSSARPSASTSTTSTSSNSNSSAFGRRDHVGPFPLPSREPSFASDAERRAEIAAASRTWSSLGKRQKLGRAFGTTLSLVVVLSGAGVACLVFYSTGTELFASNSPTRIYEDAIERIKNDAEVRDFLVEPFSFHSSNGVHRSRRVTSSLSTEPGGKEVMRLHFFINAVDPAKKEQGWFDWLKSVASVAIWEDTNKPGSFVSSHEQQLERERIEAERKATEDRRAKEQAAGWTTYVTNAFGTFFSSALGLRSSSSSHHASSSTSVVSRRKKPPRGTYSSGEVVAELVKDASSETFVYRVLAVDIPHSRDPNKWQIMIDTVVREPPQKAPDRLRFITRSQTA